MTIAPEISPPAPAGSGRRRPLVIALAVVLAAAVVAAFVVLGGGDEPSEGTDPAAASPSATESVAEGTPPPLVPPADPAAPPVDAAALPAALPAVGLGEPVVVEEMTASLVSVESIDAQATGPGSVAGPAVRVTVRIQNGSGAALALDGVSVNVTYGDDEIPASPVEDPSRRSFSGTVEPGAAGEGVYVFTVPEGSRDLLTVRVGYRPGAPIAVFSGSAG